MTPWTAAYQAPLSMRFSRQGYQSGSPLPSPSDLLNPGIEPGSPALHADSTPTELSKLLMRRIMKTKVNNEKKAQKRSNQNLECIKKKIRIGQDNSPEVIGDVEVNTECLHCIMGKFHPV